MSRHGKSSELARKAVVKRLKIVNARLRKLGVPMSEPARENVRATPKVNKMRREPSV